MLILLLAGIARLWLLVRAGWMVDFDEAVVGIAGIRILSGNHPYFFYGQPYMGALESYAAAGMFYLLDVNRLSLKLVVLIGSIAFVATIVWLGNLISGKPGGLLAGLIAAIAPVYVTVNELRALGGYIEVMLLGNIALGFALLLAFFPSRSVLRTLGRHLALGLAVGLGFWVNWLIADYAVPITLLLLARLRSPSVWWGIWLTPIAFLLGSSPLWVYNLEHEGASFNWLAAERAHAYRVEFTPDVVFEYALTTVLPRIVGARQPWGEIPDVLGVVAVAVVLLGFAALFLLPSTGLAGRRAAGAGLQASDTVIFFALSALGIYAMSTFGQIGAIYPTQDYTGRYLLPLATAIPIAVAQLLVQWRSVWPILRAGIGAVFLTAMGWGYLTADPQLYFLSPYYPYLDITQYERVVERLDLLGIRDVWTDIGLGRVMAFETSERIRTADYLDLKLGAGIDRLPEHTKAVEAAERPPFVVVILTQGKLPIEEALEELGTPYHVEVIHPYAIVIPDEPVPPKAILWALGPQRDLEPETPEPANTDGTTTAGGDQQPTDTTSD